MRLSRHLVLALFASVVLAVPVAFAVTTGTYRGKVTGGGNAVLLKVQNNRLTKFEGSIYASCGLSNFNVTVAYPPAGRRGATAKITDGKFRVVFRGSPDVEDDRRTVTGTFSGGRVTGRIRVTGPCSSAGSYSAKR